MIKHLILISAFIFTSNIWANGDSTGAPLESCELGQGQSNTMTVVESMKKTDVVVPITLRYGALKIGTASFKITHHEGKVLSATIGGEVKINLPTLPWQKNKNVIQQKIESEKIDLDRLEKGEKISYYTNRKETPIIVIDPVSITEKGGSVMLMIKKKKGQQETIPLSVSSHQGSFAAFHNGQVVKNLDVFVGFDIVKTSKSFHEGKQDIVGGHIGKYKIFK